MARPDDYATQAILSICPVVYAVVADTNFLRVLAPLIRLGRLCDETRLDTLGPYWIGLPPPDRSPITMSDLRLLVALSQATSLEDAAARAAISLRTFYPAWPSFAQAWAYLQQRSPSAPRRLWRP